MPLQGQEWDFYFWWRSLGLIEKWVFLLLFIMLCQAVFVLLARTRKLRRELRNAQKVGSVLDRTTGPRTVQEAITTLRTVHTSHVAELAVVGLVTYQVVPTGLTDTEALELAENAIDRQRSLIRAEMMLGRSTLSTIGYMAPFVGLVGTVFGILNCFRGSAESRTSLMAAIASAVASALLPTAVGLAGGVLAVWFYNRLTRTVESVLRAIDDTAFQVFLFLQCHADDPRHEVGDPVSVGENVVLDHEARFDRYATLRVDRLIHWFPLASSVVVTRGCCFGLCSPPCRLTVSRRWRSGFLRMPTHPCRGGLMNTGAPRLA